MNQIDINKIDNYFFIGVAGAGMSAIAQYLSGIGKKVSGSDRYFTTDNSSKIRIQLEKADIKTYPQDGSAISDFIEIVVVSTAVEEQNIEYQEVIRRNLKIVHRADLLAAISETKKTIAIAGTSGKSTTVAMLYQIMEYANYNPSLITGAGLSKLIKKGKIGNAVAGKGKYLIIEADESDGTLVKYKADTGVILNIEKDHKELEELEEIFGTFKKTTKNMFSVNQSNKRASKFSENRNFDFGYDVDCKYNAINFKQKGYKIFFNLNNEKFEISTIGMHNMENALAAISIANLNGISLKKCADALKTYEGIYRRMQIISQNENITLIDDYAHNPVKIEAAIKACQQNDNRVIAWFQPHGFGPTRFLKNEFIEKISNTLREQDQIWMSEIYYAGGTANKDISALDLINGIKIKNKKAFFIENRNDFIPILKQNIKTGDTILLMGARDPSLEDFTQLVNNKLFTQ
ncbi:MAG: UDP-N-acetylmuramate--alanine ligase [Bacteroidales bacterium]|nr:UDP-N-acetylmuramate--alanine ligase [Bacteroidales bacterium]MBN2755923.1 UDP-N-acetylmuramate--alanine ligase [Bacteroidales bacterium]